MKAQNLANTALAGFTRAVRASATEVRLAQLQAQRAVASAALAAGRLNGMSAAETLAMRQHIAGIDQETAAMRSNAVANMARQQSLMRLATATQAASQAATAAGYTLTLLGAAGIYGLSKAVGAAKEYDRQVRLTSTQVTTFKANLQDLGNIGLKVARDIAVPFEQIQPALYDIFSSMTVGLKDSEVLLRAFSKAAVAGQTSITDVSRGTIGILNSFHLSADKVNHVLDLQFKFIQKGIGTYAEWASKIGLVSPSAVRAGQSLETMMSALASASRMSGVASRAGIAVARAFDAFSNANAVKKIQNLGIAVKDSAGNFRPFIDVMFDIRKHIDKIPGQVAKAKAIQDIFKGAGGTIEARRFLNNLLMVGGNLEELQQIYKETQDAAGSLDAAYGTMSDSVAAKTQLLKNNWQVLKINLGTALIPAFNSLVEWIGKLVKSFNDLDPHTRDFIAKALLLAAVLAAVGGPILVVLGGIGSIISAFILAGPVFAGVLLALGAIGVAVGILALSFINAYNNSESFRKKVNELKDAFLEAKKKIVDTFGPIIKDIKEQFIPKLEEAKRTIEDIAENALKKIKDIIKDYINPTLDKMNNWWKENKATVLEFVGLLGQVVKWVSILISLFTAAGGVEAFRLWAVQLLGLLAILDITVRQLDIWRNVINEVKELWNRFTKNLSDNGPWYILFASVDLAIYYLGLLWDWLKKIGNMFSITADTIVNAFGTVPARVAAALTGLPRAVLIPFLLATGASWSEANRMADGVTGFMKQIPPRVQEALGSLTPVVRERMGSATEAAASQATNLSNRVTGIIRGVPVAVATALAGIAGSVRSAMGPAVGAAEGMGSAISSGIASGIRANIPSIRGAVSAATAAAVVTGRGSIKAASPSKVFADQVGKPIITGIIKGIMDSKPQLMRTMGQVIDPAGVGGLLNTYGGQPVSHSKNVIVNVYTNEIDPRFTAARLGFELAGAL